MENNKRVIVLMAILVLAAVAVGTFMYVSKNKQSNTAQEQVVSNEPAKTEAKPVVKQIQNNQVPKGLSDSIPMDADAQIIQNYEATTKDNKTQGTRKFTTKLSFEAATKLYTDYFTKQGWVTADQQTGDGYASTMMKRNQSTLLIFISFDKNLDKNVVEITTTEQK